MTAAAQTTRPLTCKPGRKSKTDRRINWEVRESYARGVLRVTEGNKTDFYAVAPMPADFGNAFVMLKISDTDANEPYAVCVHGDESTCECKGFLRHGHCRHVSGLSALAAAARM